MVYRLILNESQLGLKLASLKGSTSPIYLYFTTTIVEGKRWCPDCRSAEPVLEEAFGSLPASATILEIQVPRESWKVEPGPNHPFRKPPFNVRGLPTLSLWNATIEKVEKSFTEGECEQLESLLEVFSSRY